MITRTYSGSFAIISGTPSEILGELEAQKIRSISRIAGMAYDAANDVVVIYGV